MKIWIVLAACGQPAKVPIDASPIADARVDAAVRVDGGLCGGVASPCNTIANLGSVVQATCVAGSPPTMTGGPIANGTYVLVSAQAYAASCSGASLPSGGPTTMVIADGCMQSIDGQGGAQNYAIAESDNKLSFERTCSGPLSFSDTYTATATTLLELAPFSASVVIVSTFELQ